jgi:hypothetical protein
MNNKRNIILLFLAIFSISFISSYSISPAVPLSISMKCGENYNNEFIITPNSSEQIEFNPLVISDDGMQMATTYYSSTNHFYISFFYTDECSEGKRDFSFEINDHTYNIKVNVTDDLSELDTVSISEGDYINVGGELKFYLTKVGDGKIYLKSECIDDKETDDDVLNEDESYEVECNDENFKFVLDKTYEDLDYAKVIVYSSENGYSISLNKDSSSNGCVLGLDTLGAKVKRGNIFAIKTIDANTNTYVGSVAVTIIDQAGEISAINGISSNIGFFSERLHEDYEQDLVVQLEKQGCEPYTSVILFESSYNDYLDEKEKKESSTTLKLVLDSKFITGKEISGKVTNLLGDTISEAVVKITNPDNTNFELKSSDSGIFKFTPETIGTYKIQISKSSYTSSELYEFTSNTGDYDVISYVDGKKKSKFDSGDIITFKIEDFEENIVDATFDATYNSQTIKFTNGVSKEVEFVNNAKLLIPSFDGYEESDITTKEIETKSNLLWWIIGIVALIILIVVVLKWSSNTPQVDKMRVQFGQQ